MIKAVLFDLDGVLVDSEAFSFEASREVLAKAGIELTDDEERRAFGRRTLDNYNEYLISRGLDLDPYELIRGKLELYKRLISGRLKPLPGAIQLITGAIKNGYKVAVVSSSPAERVEATLREAGLHEFIGVVVSGDHVRQGKPDPEPFLYAAALLDVDPRECVVFEDAEFGVVAAKKAGMTCIALESPNTHGQDLSLADIVLNSLSDFDYNMLG